MCTRNLLAVSDEEYLAELIREWQQFYELWKADMNDHIEWHFAHWAAQAYCFAQRIDER